jgi:hypothetical protein
MLDKNVMLRNVSVRRGTTQLAGDRKGPIARYIGKGFALADKTYPLKT